ncbi:unnamed protein product [Aphanomyces euteiches]
MELIKPNYSVVRGNVLAYFAAKVQLTPVFDFRMPDEKVEIKKYSSTMTFLRRLMEVYQYTLIDINDANPPSEMEALVDWLFSEGTPLAQQHSEFALTRDIVTMCKFLATMETQEDELMRRRTGLRQWQMWSLTFDESTRFRRRPGSFMAGKLKWEVSGFRGHDQDIADIDVTGFNSRKLFFGEGPVVISPAALGPLLQTSSSVLTEDDILHSDTLPLFQGTLSKEESEYLLCYLTVPYTRIPLTLNFFSSRDRVMYLFNPMLQSLLRAVLFEGGDWVYREHGESHADVITHVPLRKSAIALQEDAFEQAMDARVHYQKAADHLGTMNGLLLNELVHSPEATILPIIQMLKAITELGDASVHSSDASFLLFMIQLGVDVSRYLTYAAFSHASVEKQETLKALRRELMDQTFGFGLATLEKWRIEAEESNDLRTACVVHSYITLLFTSMQEGEYTTDKIAQLMGSVAYVRNWHCFGMHVLIDDEDGTLSSEERLIRWLQAHGIDTKNVASGSLEKYLTDRPLFLKVGMDIIQAPNILKKSSQEAAKSPPGSVLENEMFELLQAKRRSIISFVANLSPEDVNDLLNKILHIALRTQNIQDTHTWLLEAGSGEGRYICRQAEMKVDFQSGEILWRNDELKPVPDSMIQYSDYRHEFGQEALHCGLIAHQTHRLWVHIIGTKYELMEWDQPTDDQGLGMPAKYSRPKPLDDTKMYWECPACTCANFNGDQPNARCEVCGSLKDAPQPAAQSGDASASDGGFIVQNTVYNRAVDPYSKEQHPEESELWAVNLIQEVLRALFPENHPTKKLPCTFYLPEEILDANATEVKLIGWHENNPPKMDFQSTFKEIIVYRHYNMLQLFAWISHGRRLCRKLIFTSNARLSFHGFVPSVESEAQVDECIQYAAGDFLELQPAGGSLVIVRRTRGMETFVPPRLLQGLIPSAFLESYKFWLGEDKLIRGEPLDSQSQWFRYHLEIVLEPTTRILRKAAPTIIEGESAVSTAPSPAPSAPAVPPIPVNDDDVVQLMALGFSYAGCVLALREYHNDMENAAQWLLDESNQTKLVDAEQTIIMAEASAEESAIRASVKEVKPVASLFSDDDLVLLNPLQIPSAKTVCHQPTAGASVVAKPARLKVGGQPWVKLNMLSTTFLKEHATAVTHVRYKRPAEVLEDEECLKLVWDHMVVADEASGANRGLGCLFLYQCLEGKIKLQLYGIDRTRSLGELLGRILHLKLARWGKEVVEDGEEEIVVPVLIAQFAAVVAYKNQQWPVLPQDTSSVMQLERGINLFSKAMKDTMLKHFFEIVQVSLESILEANQDIPALRQQLSQAHQAVKDVSIAIKPSPFSLRLTPSNSSCDLRRVQCQFDPLKPLGFLDANEFVVFAPRAKELAQTLPFDLQHHPSAQSVVAKDLLQRLIEDVKNHAQAINSTQEAYFIGITRSGFDALTAQNQLNKLITTCTSQRSNDANQLLHSITLLENRINAVELSQSDSFESKLAKSRYLIRRQAGQTHPADLNYIVSTFSSTLMEVDLKKKNPFFPSEQFSSVVEMVQNVLFVCNRINQLNRLIQAAEHLKKLTSSQNVPRERLLHASQDVANQLNATRHYIKQSQYDPRYLVFEYVFELMLRSRQVEMVDSFMRSLSNGNSRVQQMIMGAGKTTVVGPLLTFMLADSTVLVTHVMPTALLEQSRAVLRSRFSNAIMAKRIFTLRFDRSIEDNPALVVALASKLIRACREGDVMCASPEAIKSLFLKFVELLHSLDQSTFDNDFDLHDSSKTGQRIRSMLTARSDMADELHQILRLWQKGVLIMDEVDVLLHPLRSELNFPIGNKFPIDLAANRWELPLYLLDTIFSNKNEKLIEVLNYGYSIHALQRFPHLVLLDQGFYDTTVRPLLATLLYNEWLLPQLKMGKNDLTSEEVVAYIQADSLKKFVIEDSLSEHGLKLLNLSRDWIRSLLPHCLSKINRVSYGLLRSHHVQETHTPSRLLLAVPFVGKDVPSRSSEFAHPDVLIGLTILAYRYEGIRRSDAKTIVSQLKNDFSRQLGPRDERPACVLFRSWITEGLEKTQSVHGVLPLPLFQLNDASQVTRLLQLIQLLPSVVYYYVRQHVFPSCMNFQKLKVSACGHELGSSSLFARRIGFSGTPSNLLPLDLGTCYYEPQSDGNIFSVLTSPQVTTLERKLNWTATSLLRDIATSDPPFHALIDTGALITGLDNEQVARYLLEHLPPSMEGVVYLDTSDRQMILLRDHNSALPLIQCGLSPEKRFTFYDQVHTTGMDIKQGINARAVLTLGKDMTFRDYAQGAYRMRGIGAGQVIHLYLIPEVENRIRQELSLIDTKSIDDFRLHVPAWLLVNSMKMESMQLVQLSLQELHNVWRTRALESLLIDVDRNKTTKTSGQRLLRFHESPELRPSIDAFRVQVSYAVPAQVPVPRALTDTIKELTAAHENLLDGSIDYTRIDLVTSRVASLVDMSSDMHLNAEVVHENEAEAEEEAEEEAEQEEQKMSAYPRDDEHPVPWSTDVLRSASQNPPVFFPLSLFQAQSACRAIPFPETMLVSDNYFRRRWIGLGERRLKNIGFLMEWHPEAVQNHLKARVAEHFTNLIATGLAPTDAAAQAIQLASKEPIVTKSDGFLVALSLAEGETIRRMLHCAHPVLNISRIQLHMSDGALVESSHPGPPMSSLAQDLQCFRFFNNEMYYTADQLNALLGGLKSIPLHLRHEFFQSTLRLRRRERQLWGDTPLAKVFTKEDEWHLLSARAKMEQFQRGIKAKKISLVSAWHRFDSNNDGRLTYDELLRCFESFQLGFSPGDLNEIIGLMEGHDGVTISKLAHSFDVDLMAEEAEAAKKTLEDASPWLCEVCTFGNEGFATSCGMCNEPREHTKQVVQGQTWQCENCTFINPITETSCGVCELGMSGRREVPKDKWVCDPEQGGCTYFNPKTAFYCDVCNRARPDLSSRRF